MIGFPLLTYIIVLPLIGAGIIAACRSEKTIKAVAMIAGLMTLLLTLVVLHYYDTTKATVQFVHKVSWLPKYNIEYYVGVDGLSVLMLPINALFTVIAIVMSYKVITRQVKAYYAMLLCLQGITAGVFVSLNLIVFFFIWEAMLIPSFLLIGMWGGKASKDAAMKYLIYAFAGSIFMFVAIIVMYFAANETFDMIALSKAQFSYTMQMWLFAAFTIAFAVKVPLVPVHSWQPDAYYESSMPVTVILSAVLAKMGVYGFLRMPFSFFPDALAIYSTPLITLSLISILYGAYLALAQTDLKRLIAYASLSHMGFMTLAIATLNPLAIQGAILQMVNHAVITGALFISAWMLYEKTGTYDMTQYGGAFKSAPVFAVIFTFFSLATTGFPAMSYFFAELLILSGVFKLSVYYGSLAVFGVVLGLCYTSWAYYRIVLFERSTLVLEKLSDITAKDVAILAPLIILTIWLGVQPSVATQFTSATVNMLTQSWTKMLLSLSMMMHIPF